MSKILERERAILMRKEGKKLSEIAKELNVSKGSVSMWAKDISDSSDFQRKFKEEPKRQKLIIVQNAKRDMIDAKKKERDERIFRQIKTISDGNQLIDFSGRVIVGKRWFIRAPTGYAGKTYINNKYILEYRYIMEKKIGRLLTPNDIVHHINGNQLDDRIENLELTTRKSHNHIHHVPMKMQSLVCPNCFVTFSIRYSNYIVKVKTQRNFFCSISCGTTYNKKKCVQKDSNLQPSP